VDTCAVLSTSSLRFSSVSLPVAIANAPEGLGETLLRDDMTAARPRTNIWRATTLHERPAAARARILYTMRQAMHNANP